MEPQGVLLAQRAARWDALRDMGRVVQAHGVYHLTHRDDVLAALRNPAVFSRGGRRSLVFDMIAAVHPGAQVPPVPSGFDPPELTRYRKILQPLFSRHAVQELVPAATSHAAVLVDDIAPNGQCDASSAVAVPYPIQVLLTFCGLPAQDRDVLTRWTNTIHAATEHRTPAYQTASLKLFGYLAAAIKQRHHNPSLPGFLTQLVTSGLSDAEALGAAVLTVLGGANTVTIAIGSALLTLADQPQLRALLRANPEQTKPFVDEVLRLDPPASSVTRQTTRDITIGAVTIPARSLVALRLGAMNREDSNDITAADGQITRRPHWAFGAGPHRCLGAYLAREEVTVLVNEWLRRIPDFEVQAGYIPPAREVIGNGLGYTMPALPLQWTAIGPPQGRECGGPILCFDGG